MANNRPDLAALTYKAPPMIGGILYPALTRRVKQGVIYWRDIVADPTAATSRTLGAAPSATLLSDAKTAFNLEGDEYIHRHKVDSSTITGYGGLDAAQQVMARLGKRAVMNKHEAAVVAATFGAITPVDITTSFLAALDVGKRSIEDYGADGRIALFGAQNVINRLKRYNEVVERMSFTGVPIGNQRDVRSISDDVLAAALGVDVVIPGPNTIWLGSGSVYDGYLGLAVIANPDAEPVEELQFGRTVTMPVDAGANAGNIFEVLTYYSDDLRSEVVDVAAWMELHTYNVELMYVFSGVDEENAVTTTAGS